MLNEVKMLKNQSNSIDLSKCLANKMGSSVTVKFKIFSPGEEDNFFQKIHLQKR